MTRISEDLEARLARFVEHHVLEGEQLAVDLLCADRPDLAAPLNALIHRYLALTASLEPFPVAQVQGARPERAAQLRVEGFETIERIGSGGMGEVFKLRDLRLNRVVAAKVIRASRDGGWRARLDGFIREARNLALFKDRRIVQIHEVRLDADPPVIIMEHVEGFELGRLGPSLEYAQRARILVEICDAIHQAHTLGLQHRDLKPSNIMLDATLSPRILDFGLSSNDPGSGHFFGTLPTSLPSNWTARRPSTHEPMSMRWASSSTNCCAGGRRSRETSARSWPPSAPVCPAFPQRLRHRFRSRCRRLRSPRWSATPSAGTSRRRTWPPTCGATSPGRRCWRGRLCILDARGAGAASCRGGARMAAAPPDLSA